MDSSDEDTKVLPFHEMGIDPRILEGIMKLTWPEPTPIQEKAIPLALEGKDILAKACTGSGKTGAFAIPVIQKILKCKEVSDVQEVRAIILVPSKELGNQINENIKILTKFCSGDVRSVFLSGNVSVKAQKPLLLDKPDIVIGTPSRILAHMQESNLGVKESLEFLVIDEADVMFSFGYENDLNQILGYLPQSYQAFLASSTLNNEVLAQKKILLQNPVTLKLSQTLPRTTQLTQYVTMIEEDEKFALLCAMFKLSLIKGKTIIFVNSVKKCYRLKIFLEQFGISSCIMNSELPAASRCHAVNKFNTGKYRTIIAADEFHLLNPTGRKEGKRKKDKESGASRGIDFHEVANIINFDFPITFDSYVHRVGRTARGTCKGTAISFVSVGEKKFLEEVKSKLAEEMDVGEASVMQKYQFKKSDITPFKYRASDVLHSVTELAVKEARLKEIRTQIMASEKLKTYFENNPKDLQALQLDKELSVVQKGSHLKDVPEYIIPPSLKETIGIAMSSRKRKPTRKERKDRKDTKKARKSNPLKNFKFRGFKKQ